MTTRPHILIVDDSPDDAELIVRTLRGGYDPAYSRVDTPEAMQAALRDSTWDLVIADYSMPQFSGLAAFELLRNASPEMPFILVSGTIGEELAVEAMKSGVSDYVLKSNLPRLLPAVERELREAEERRQLRRAEARYASLSERVPIGLYRISPEGEILEANPALIEMLGFKDAASVNGANSEQFWVQPSEREQMIAALQRDGIVKNFEMALRRRDGGVIWCEQTARAVLDAAGKLEAVEGVMVDVTGRKQAEEEINRARDRVRDLALESARLRSEFLASMSHEIRTPLNGIIGTVELLSFTDLSPEQRRHTEIIRSSSELLLSIVNDILDFSKLAAGKVVLEKIDFDPIELTEGLIDSFAGAARAKRIELSLCVDLNMPTGLRGDPGRLRQILNNLVANAIKFTERGEVTVHASRDEESDCDVSMRFEVKDTGIGIPLEAQERLFQPFVQAEGSTSRRFGGTGLGLVIADKLTRQMGGEIGFESTPGAGSTFHFTARLEKGTEIVRPWMSPTAASYFGEIRVLIVNDNPASRQVISRYLTSWGIENAMVSSAPEVLDDLKRAPARNGKRTVVLLDELMSGMSPLSLARAIKKLPATKPTKVVMLGAQAGACDANAEADDWIVKPIRPSSLFSSLLKLCMDNGERIAVEAPPRVPTPPEPQKWRRSIRVLLVDDNLVNRTMAAQQLARLGYTAEIVEDAQRGLELVASGQFDIVLMDCEMPVMDGYQATAEIRRLEENTSHTIVIALTAHATEGDRERCIQAGMDDYLSKPLKLQTLAAMLDRWAPQTIKEGAAPVPEDLGIDAFQDEVLDPATLADLAQLAPELLRQLADAFLADLPARVASIEAAVGAQDIPTLAFQAHSLRSSSAILGANRFSALCAKVEDRARSGKTDDAAALVKDLLDAARRLPGVLNRAAGATVSPPIGR